ncbi:MAG: SHOCT domain-containing protein [Treponema sp.]|nr:SHOCT domain-containing protein [Treponema sp.]
MLAFILAFSLAAAVVLIRFYYQESYPAENVYGPVPQKIESTEKNKYSFTEEKTSSINADELVKLKKLLDDGIITQEDFDAKKKELLGL